MKAAETLHVDVVPPAATPQPLCGLRPFIGKGTDEVVELLRNGGMLAPLESCREGIDALLIRSDVKLDDACNSLDILLGWAQGVLVLLASNAGDLAVSNAASAVDGMLSLARGHLTVIVEGVQSAWVGRAAELSADTAHRG